MLLHIHMSKIHTLDDSHIDWSNIIFDQGVTFWRRVGCFLTLLTGISVDRCLIRMIGRLILYSLGFRFGLNVDIWCDLWN